MWWLAPAGGGGGGASTEQSSFLRLAPLHPALTTGHCLYLWSLNVRLLLPPLSSLEIGEIREVLLSCVSCRAGNEPYLTKFEVSQSQRRTLLGTSPQSSSSHFQQAEAPSRGLLHGCETSNFANVRFQLYMSPCHRQESCDVTGVVTAASVDISPAAAGQPLLGQELWWCHPPVHLLSTSVARLQAPVSGLV